MSCDATVISDSNNNNTVNNNNNNNNNNNLCMYVCCYIDIPKCTIPFSVGLKNVAVQ